MEALGVWGIVSTAAVFILRKFIDSSFAMEMESFKAGLEKEATKFRTQFQHLHAERAEVIKQTYQKLVTVLRNLESMVRPFQWKGEDPPMAKWDTFISSFDELHDYFLSNKLFFDYQLATEIENLLKVIAQASTKWSNAQIQKLEGNKEYWEAWKKVWGEVKKDIPGIVDSIEKKFRQIIGIESQ